MKIEAYAKVNFTLEVFGKRVDGYHALRSVVVPTTLSDTLELAPAAGGVVESDTGYADDLCVKAAKALARQVFGFVGSEVGGLSAHQTPPTHQPKHPQTQIPGVRIHVEKRIPAGGGLGGGSADAAAVLWGLNELWGLSLPVEKLAEIGAEVGSDVPALVLSRVCGPVLMEGRGEKVSPVFGLLGSGVGGSLTNQYNPNTPEPQNPNTPEPKHPNTPEPKHPNTPNTPEPKHPNTQIPANHPTLHLVLLNPGVFSSTAEVYRETSPRLSDDPSILYNIRTALGSGDLAGVASSLMNDLEEPAMRLHPEIAEAKRALLDAGAAGALMSGSGSTVFGLVPDEARGREIAALLGAKGYRAWSVKTYCPVV